ncbi:MAG: biotin biosynthesis protein BioY [Prochlorococcus sp. SP3034]|nr:biotin biosynthesis protein BioY [Prochlorococcus sp. SP3034]|tara:strand:- start:54 stop:620 length:567 start_codon:yes stop_codon:yes gene_type:complete
MLNHIKIIEIFISLESIFIATMLPIYISLPSNKNFIQIYDIPTTWQVPTIIFLTIIFSGEIVYKAFSIYIFIGLFILPVFYDGGSLGYILTPNFGYLLGIYPLIKIISKLNTNKNFSLKTFIQISTLALIIMHSVGILFTSIQSILFSNINIIPYNIGKFTLSKILFELLLLFPILLLLNLFKKKRFL